MSRLILIFFLGHVALFAAGGELEESVKCYDIIKTSFPSLVLETNSSINPCNVIGTNVSEEDKKIEGYQTIGNFVEECMNDYCESVNYGLSVPGTDESTVFNSDIKFCEVGPCSSPKEQHANLLRMTIGSSSFTMYQSLYMAYMISGKPEVADAVYLNNATQPQLKRQVADAAQQPGPFTGEVSRLLDIAMVTTKYGGDVREYLGNEFFFTDDDRIETISILQNVAHELAVNGSLVGISTDELANSMFSSNMFDSSGKLRLSADYEPKTGDSLIIPSDMTLENVCTFVSKLKKIGDLNSVGETVAVDVEGKEALKKELSNIELLDAHWSDSELNELEKNACSESGKKGWKLPSSLQSCKAAFLDGFSDKDPDYEQNYTLDSSGQFDEETLFSKLEEEHEKRFGALSEEQLNALKAAALVESIKESMLLEIRNNPDLVTRSLIVGPEGVEVAMKDEMIGLVEFANSQLGKNEEIPENWKDLAGQPTGFDFQVGDGTSGSSESVPTLSNEIKNKFTYTPPQPIYSDDVSLESVDSGYYEALKGGDFKFSFNFNDEDGNTVYPTSFWEYYNYYLDSDEKYKMPSYPAFSGIHVANPADDIASTGSVYNCAKSDPMSSMFGSETNYCGNSPLTVAGASSQSPGFGF